MCVYVCQCMPVRTEDSFQKSFSPAVGSGAQTQVIRLCIKCFYPLHPVAPLLHVLGRGSLTEPGAGPRGPHVSRSTHAGITGVHCFFM